MVRRALCFCAALLWVAAEGQSVEIPFSPSYKGRAAIIVDVKLNGHGPYPFILDTGATYNAIDESLVDEVGAVQSGELAISGGGRRSASQPVFKIKEMMIGATPLRNDKFLAIRFPKLTPFRGIVGVDLFLRYGVQVDFDRRVVTTTRESHFHYAGSGTPIHLDIDTRTYLPRVRAVVDGHEGNFILDTGNEKGLVLHAEFVRGNHIGESGKVIASSFRTVTGDSPATETMLASFQIGPHAMGGQAAVLLPSDSDADPRVAGSIGLPELSRFNAAFDFGNEVVYIEKNRSFDVLTEGPRSGIVRDAAQSGFVILYVIPDGPADSAGLAKGDRVVQIDGVPVSKLGDLGLTDKFFQPAGTTIGLTISRKGKTKIVVLTLRDVL